MCAGEDSDIPLDERLYDLTEEDRTFLKQQTGIQDDDELKAHLFQVQAEAYEVYPYPCIRLFNFAKLNMWRLPVYQDLLKKGKSGEDAIFLDIGSGMGNDARKLVADGYPLEQVITSDLHQEFADLGHKLFRTTQETYPIAFVSGDIFDPNHLKVVPPVVTSAHGSTLGDPSVPAPDLRSLTSLNPLHGRAFAIHTSNFFHLFGEEEQLHVARAFAGLLSQEPGSVIFGVQGSAAEKGFSASALGDHRLWLHSPESWTELWDGIVFEKGVVNVQTKLVQLGKEYSEPDGPQHTSFTMLVWSVTRL